MLNFSNDPWYDWHLINNPKEITEKDDYDIYKYAGQDGSICQILNTLSLEILKF